MEQQYFKDYRTIAMKLITLFFIFKIFNEGLSKEYCAHEYFNPQCGDDEVIVMERASYGRMEAGRCIKIQIDSSRNDLKYFGCKVDVMDVLDKKCSGRQKCTVLVMDTALMMRSTCYEDLVHYLEADYFCQTVARIDNTCNVGLHGSPIHLLREQKPGDKRSEKCGGVGNPLTIEASVGQNIKVSIMLFDHPNKSITSETNLDHETCGSSETGLKQVLGSFKESNERISRKYFCAFNGRQMEIMTSKSNKIQLETNADIETRFLLLFEASGCYDLKPPQDAWMKREGNEITVGCYMNRHTWKLVCNGRNWIGVIGNCTQHSRDILEVKENLPSQITISKDNEFVFLLAVGVSLLILMALTVTCGLVIFFQKSNLSRKYRDSSMYDGNINQPFNTIINGDLKALHEKQTNGILESSYQDPGYYVLENDDGNKDKI